MADATSEWFALPAGGDKSGEFMIVELPRPACNCSNCKWFDVVTR